LRIDSGHSRTGRQRNDSFAKRPITNVSVIILALSPSGVLFVQLESLSIGDDHKLTEHEERDWNVSSSVIHSQPTKEARHF